MDALIPILDQFVASAEGHPSQDYWESIYHHQSGSGISRVTGWCNVLYPYLKTRKGTYYQNPYINDGKSGTDTSALPSGLSKVPFDWEYLGFNYDMQLTAGFVKAEYNEGKNYIRPNLVWCVAEAEED